MSMMIPPADATDEQIERFIASLREEARERVRKMLADGAPEDEVIEYIQSLDAAADDPSAGA